jgi:hypothetical protein
VPEEKAGVIWYVTPPEPLSFEMEAKVEG